MKRIILALFVTLCSLSAVAQTPSCPGPPNKPTPACLPTSNECSNSSNCIQSCSIANVCTTTQTGDDPRTFPGTVMNSNLVAPSGTSRAIHNMTDFNNALTAMVCGDELVLDDDNITGGTAFSTIHGITLPNIASGGSGWITIRSSGTTDPSFPAEHNRTFKGDNTDGSASATSKAVVLPLLASFPVHAVTGADFIFQFGQPSTSCHYRIIGLNLFATGGNAPAFGNGIKGAAGSGAVVELINLVGADHTVFDRNYMHGTLDDSFAVTSCSVASNVATINTLNYASVGDTVLLSGLTGSCAFLNSTTAYTITAVDTSFQSAAITSIATGTPPTTGCTAPASSNLRATMASNPFVNNTRVIINTPNGALCTGSCNGSWTGDRTATNVTSTTFDYGSTGNCSQPNTFTGTNLTARSLGGFVQVAITHANLSTTASAGLAFFAKSPNILGVGTRELLSRVFNAAPTVTYMALVDNYFDQVLGPQSTDYQVWFTRPANTAETASCHALNNCDTGFFKFVNNYLEGSEAIFSGGAGFNADNNAVPHDFEIRNNVFNIPQRWFYMAAAHNDRVNYNYYKIVDNWEIKTGQRGLVTGNIHHGVWAWGGAGDSGQNARLNLQGNQSGTNANVRDWTIVNNLFDGANVAITHAGGSQTCGLGGTPASPFCKQLDYEISEVQQNNLVNLTGPGYTSNNTVIGASSTAYGADSLANVTNVDIEHQTAWTTVPSGQAIVANGSLVFNVNGPGNNNFKVLPALDDITTCVCTGGNTIPSSGACSSNPPTGNRGVGMGANWTINDTFKIDPTGPSGCPDGMTYKVTNVGSNGCMQDAVATWTATSAIASCTTTAHVPVVVTHCAITGGCTGLQLYVFRGPDDVNLWYKNNVAAMRAAADSSGIQGSAALNNYMPKPSPAGANDLKHRYSGNYIQVYPNQNINTSQLNPTVNFDCGTTGTPSTYDPTVTNNSNCEIQSSVYVPNARFNFTNYDTSGGGICSSQHPCDLTLVNPYVSLDVTNTACIGTNCAGVDFNSSVGLFQAIANVQSGRGCNVCVLTTSIPNGAVGEAYNVVFQASGGTPPYTWTKSWTLPSGLSLSAGGTLSGTPAAATQGTYTGTVTATDSLSVSSPPQSETLVVNSRLTLSSNSLPTCTVGIACSMTLQSTGGIPPFTYAAPSGAMSVCPTTNNGLCLNAMNGSISGTPLAAGSQVFTAQILDAGISNCTGANSPACQSYTLTTLGNFQYVSPISIPTMVEQVAITPIPVVTSGSTGTPTCALSSGSFPTGVSLTGCTISGTPGLGTSGPYSIVIQVTDVGGTGQVVSSGTLSWSVQTGLSFTTTSCPNGVVNQPYTCTLNASGGITPYTFSIIAGALPAGTVLNGNVITGFPTTIAAYMFTPQVADSETPPKTAGPSGPFTVQITPTAPTQLNTQTMGNVNVGGNVQIVSH